MYKQYLVLIKKGCIETTSLAALDFYYVTEEEKNPTEVAFSFKENFNKFCEQERIQEEKHNKFFEGKRDKVQKTKLEIFNILFNLQSHETCGEQFEELEENGWFTFSQRLPIDKIVYLADMEDFLSDDKDNFYFAEKNMRNGQVSTEVFSEINLNVQT